MDGSYSFNGDHHDFFKNADFTPAQPTKPAVIRTVNINGMTLNIIREPEPISISADDARNAHPYDQYYF